MKIAHCRKCKEPLYQMHTITGKYPASQCLNRLCTRYGKPQLFKNGLKEGE